MHFQVKQPVQSTVVERRRGARKKEEAYKVI
ncbi:hypothetical protein NC653_028594 [Populus alba x Populus x berolinensis]|uniref:Uncharacterized protein n=1 Tax=Populus alba x Populus x berolinensis TaxID=444605 RepID=A0AAD6M0G3_9ROSI|nr:hypothetical protein NC653_028594 [Populus alba x Populus x berolinensis]